MQDTGDSESPKSAATDHEKPNRPPVGFGGFARHCLVAVREEDYHPANP